MPLISLQFRAGINREGTNYANSGGWFDGNNIRFRSGYPEKIGGWTQMSANTFLGTARSLWNWEDVSGTNNYLGVGTNIKYYVESGSSFNDITPLYYTSTGLSGPFSATNGSSTITVTDATYTPNVGDYVTFSGATSLGGSITAAILNQNFQIVTVGAGIFTIKASVVANSSDTGHGGMVEADYEVPVGLSVYSSGLGWGAGPWGGTVGGGGWGSAYVSGIGLQLRLWSAGNFGSDLVYAVRGGNIYYWAASTGVTARGVSLSAAALAISSSYVNVPTQTNCVLIGAPQQFVIALGAQHYTDPTTFNPMLVRWSDQGNQYNWVPQATNQAGEYQLSFGSYIVTGQVTRQEILIWTDNTIYSMQYIGYPYVYSFTALESCRCISILHRRHILQ